MSVRRRRIQRRVDFARRLAPQLISSGFLQRERFEPPPQQQPVTTQEQIAIENRISNLENVISQGEREILILQQRAQKISAETGETPNTLKNEIRILGSQIDAQKRNLLISRTSRSVAEAEAKKQFTERGIQAQREFQKQKEKFKQDIKSFQRANPKEKLIFDKLGNVVGVQSGALQQTLSLSDYNKLARQKIIQPTRQALQLMTTKLGIVDARTGKIIAPIGTSVIEATRLAQQKFLIGNDKLDLNRISQNLMTTKKGIVDIRTGKVIIPTKGAFQKLKERLKHKFSKEGFAEINERIKAVEEIERQNLEISRSKGVKTLIKEGKLPQAVITAFRFGGLKYFTSIDILRVKVFGGKRLSKKDLEAGGDLLGEIALFAGFSPIMTSTGETIAKLPSNTIVKFVGQQKTKDGKIITDVVFSSSGKRVGIAKGVTLQKEKNAFTLTIGRILKDKKITPKIIKKIKAGKGELFTGIEKGLTKNDIQKISDTFQLPRKTLLELLKKNDKLNNLFISRQIFKRQLDRINLLLKQFIGSKRFVKIRSGIKFRKNDLLIRKTKIQNKFNSLTKKVKSELLQFKGIKRAKKIKIEVNFRRNSLIIRKHRLQNQLNSLIKELKNELLQFKGITRVKKIKEELKFRIKSLSIRKQKLQKQIQKISNELKKFKGITRVKKIKAGTKFRINSLKIRKQRLQNQLNSLIKELKNELLQFKGITRVKKIKEELKFRIKSLSIRKQRLQNQLNKIITNILPKRVEFIVTRNLKKITQVSKGKVKLGKGSKNIEDVYSIANIFNKDDISIITGNTLTKKGDMIEFIGSIKNLDKKTSSFKSGLKQIQKKKYETALEEVMKVAGSTIKTNKIKGLSKSAQRIITLNTIKPITKKIISPKTLPPIRAKAKIEPEKVIGGIKQLQKQQMDINFQVRQLKLQSQNLDTRIKQKQNQLQKGKLKQTQKQKLRQQLKQLQKLKTKMKLKLRTRLQLLQKQKQKLKTKLGLKVPTIIKTPKKKIVPFKLVIPKGFKRKVLRKAQPVFFIRIKHKGRIINLDVKPLIMKDAKDLLAYSLDHGLERSAWFEPMGKAKYVVGLPSKMKGYFSRNSKKLRPFKIRVGKKKAIRNGYIERGKYLLDTKKEKRQILIARKKAVRKTVKKKKIIKRKRRKVVKKKKKIIRKKKK